MFDLSSSTSLRARAGVDALVVVVDRHRERLLGLLLPDHVLVEDVLDLLRGDGTCVIVSVTSRSSSSARISLQSAMHSLQM
jgi:hypothetical protein